MICMRTTLILKDELVKKAQEMTGVKEKTALIHQGLELLIQQAASERLTKLRGADPNASITRKKGAGK